MTMLCSNSTLLPCLLASCTLALAACDLGEKSIGDDEGTDTESGDGDGDGDDDGDNPGDGDGDGDELGACGEETLTTDYPTDMELPDFEGATIDALLATVQGSFSGSISWLPDDGPTTSTHAMTGAQLDATISYAGGEVRLIEVENAGDFPEGQLGGQLCSHALEIDVTLDFATTDGLFAESMPATFTVRSHGEQPTPSLYQVLDMDAHQGALSYDDFSVSDDGFVRDLFLLGDVDEAGFTGSVAIEVEWMDLVGFGPMASFDAPRVP